MIRPATLVDVSALKTLAAAMHRESNFACVPFDAERFGLFVATLIGVDDAFAYVSERDGLVTGFMLGKSYPAWFGNGRDRIASDLVLYVDPDYRHSAAALLLASEFMEWARHAPDVLQVRAGTSAGRAGHAAHAIYEHLGFESAGASFVFDVGKWPQERAGQAACLKGGV